MPKRHVYDDGPSRAEADVLRQKQFYAAIGTCGEKIHDAWHTIVLEQEKIQTMVAKFAGASDRAVDDYCIHLFGQAGETTKEIRECWQRYQPVLKSIQSMCSHHVVKVNEVAESLRKRNAAFSDRRHYEDKVHSLASGERLERNKEKLRQASDALTFSQVVAQEKVRELLHAHPKLFRLTALRLSESLMLVLQLWGRATSSWDNGLHEGTEVAIIGKGGESRIVTALGPSTARIDDTLLPSVLLTPTTWALQTDTTTIADQPREASGLTIDEALSAGRLSYLSEKNAFSIFPARIRRGQEAQLTINCPALNGPIAEVFIDGQRMEVVSGTPGEVVVSGALDRITDGKVEVMTEDARRTYATGKGSVKGWVKIHRISLSRVTPRLAPHVPVHLELYELNHFLSSPAGTNVKFSTDMTSVERITGSLNALVFVSLAKPFFEFEVNEVLKKGIVRAPAFGFTTQKFLRQRLPSAAADMKCALAVGGDLPHAYIDAVKQSAKISWRPRNDLNTGDIIQVVLTLNAFKVFQNGEEAVSLALPHIMWLLEPLVGIIDVAGSLKSVTIRSGSSPLSTPLFGEASLHHSSSASEVEIEDADTKQPD